MIRIIDNKKVELTDDEYQLYQDICRSYDDPPRVKGELLFKGLFEVDEKGIIQFLIPPSERQTSMEIYLFLVAIFQQQHARIVYGRLEELMGDVRKKLGEIK